MAWHRSLARTQSQHSGESLPLVFCFFPPNKCVGDGWKEKSVSVGEGSFSSSLHLFTFLYKPWMLPGINYIGWHNKLSTAPGQDTLLLCTKEKKMYEYILHPSYGHKIAKHRAFKISWSPEFTKGRKRQSWTHTVEACWWPLSQSD